MTEEKAFAAVKTALTHIEEAVTAYSQEDLEKAKMKVWDASSEVEYALFLLELNHTETEGTEKKESPKKEVDFQTYILKAQELLKTLLRDSQFKKLEELLPTLREARRSLIALQERIERNKI